jgi:distribution and morphology protein 34
MTIRLSRLNLRAILILVVSASKGITLVFKNDPLQNVEVSSTFDSVEVIRGYLQQEIEGQLREMFREDLPGIIHRMSQTWLGRGGGGKVELPYKDGSLSDGPSAGLGTPGTGAEEEEEGLDPNDPYAEKEIFPPHPSTNSPSTQTTPQRKAVQQAKAARQRRLSSTVSESPTSYTVFPDIEDYDPTYGLRPEGVPTHSGYEAFGRLWEKARQGEGRGFGSLMQTPLEEEEEEEGRGDVSDLEDDINEKTPDPVEMEGNVLRPLDRLTRTESRYTEEDPVEWETFPAVGGGIVSRPRVYHSQSKIRAPSESGAIPSPSGGTGSVTARASSIGASSTIGVSHLLQIVLKLMILQSLRKFPQSPSMPFLHSAQAGPGPSSLRRMATTRSDIFTPQHRTTRSEIPAQAPPLSKSHSYRHIAQTPARAGTNSGTGTSWSTDHPSRSNTYSTLASSQLPSSKSNSMSISNGHGYGNGHGRSMSITGTGLTGTSPGKSFPPRNPGITLPLNNSVSQLATLSHSNHTLSPYARGHEHIAVRSFPHLGKTPSVGAQSRASSGDGNNNRANVKARRKRIYRLNTKKAEVEEEEEEGEEVLSPDLDDTPPLSDHHDYEYGGDIPEHFRRMSFGSASGNGSMNGSSWNRQLSQQQPSLTGVAQRMMRPRPNMARSPASRTSYGFPDVE